MCSIDDQAQKANMEPFSSLDLLEMIVSQNAFAADKSELEQCHAFWGVTHTYSYMPPH